MILLLFLLKTVSISLSGVMAPGAVTAATIAQGTRHRWAGIFIAVGHGIVEIPLIFLIMSGLRKLFEMDTFKISVGIFGGLFLLWMAHGMIRMHGKDADSADKFHATGPITTGIVLSATNPYFLLWWATVGLNLTIDAQSLGMLAFILFALVHWLCDLLWLTILSFAAFHGTAIPGLRNQRIVLRICGIALACFGIMFIHNAIGLWLT